MLNRFWLRDKDRKPWDSTTRMSFMIFVGVNLLIMLALWLNMSYFYLDSPLYHLKYETATRFSSWFTVSDRFGPLNEMAGRIGKLIFGTAPEWMYIVQYCFVLFAMFYLYKLLTAIGLKGRQAILTMFLMLTCSSAFENIFTVSKAEIAMMTQILLFELALYRLFTADKPGKMDLLLYCISILLCWLAKETWLVIGIPVTALTMYSCLISKKEKKKALTAFVLFIACIGLFMLYEHFYIVKSSYMDDYSLSVRQILTQLFFYLRYHWDIALIGLVSLGLCIAALIRNKDDEIAEFLLAVNLGGWGYFGGLSLWRMACSYYIYPAIAFFSVSFASVFLYGKRKKLYLAGLAVIMCFTIRINYLVAVSHIDLGQAYTEACKSIVRNVDSGGRVILENQYFYEEQVGHTKRMMDRFGGDVDIVGGYQSIYNTMPTDENLRLWNVDRETADREFEADTPRIGDYVLYFINQRDFFGPVRGVNPSHSRDDSYLRVEGSGYKTELVDKNVYTRNMLGFSRTNIIEKKPMVSGFILYRVTDKSFRTLGVTEDGWVQEEALIKDYSTEDDVDILFGPSFIYMAEGTEVNNVDFYVDDEYADTVEITGAGGDVVSLNAVVEKLMIDGERHNIRIVINKTGRPIDYGYQDDRILGVQITLTQHTERKAE